MANGKTRLRRRLSAEAVRAGLTPGSDRWHAYVDGTAARVHGRAAKRRRKRQRRS